MHSVKLAIARQQKAILQHQFSKLTPLQFIMEPMAKPVTALVSHATTTVMTLLLMLPNSMLTPPYLQLLQV
jgi:hypothetical protein